MTATLTYAALVSLMRTMPMSTDQQIEILLVEDDDDDAQLMRDALEEGSLNPHVTWVDNGEEALDYLRQRGKYSQAAAPELILLDLVLPRMTGHEVLAEVKKDAMLRRIPIVIMTSSASAEVFRAAYDLHANCCVPKPTDQEAFAKAVKKIELFWLGNPSRR